MKDFFNINTNFFTSILKSLNKIIKTIFDL